MDKRTTCNPIPDKYKIHEQDCKCVRCIDIEIDQFNPKRLLRKRPPKISRTPLLRSSRPINDKQKEKNELLINIICNNITIKLEQQELN